MMNSTLEMTHEEWLYDRQKGIGGSDVATILGLNKWKSPYQLWLEKTGQIELDEAESEAAYWGNTLEEVVAKEFQMRTGKKVRRRNQVFEHPDYPFLRANIDRDVVGENAILECKTANAYLGKEWDGDEIPQAYLCQVQHYMNVLNREYAYIAVLIGGQHFIWKRVERSQELIDLIQAQLVDFWERHVIGGEEPVVDGSDATADFLKERYAEAGENEITLPPKFDGFATDLNVLKDQQKKNKAEIQLIENQIKQHLGENDAVIGISKHYVFSWKCQNSKRLDKKKFAQKYPQAAEDPEIYNTSTTRVLREKEIG